MPKINIKIIEASNIFWKGVVQNCSLSVHRASFTVIVGPNGCGKSSLLKCLSGWNSVDTGTIEIDSTPIKQISPKKRAAVIGFLPQKITVSENIPITEWLTYSRFRFNEPKSIAINAVNEGLKRAHLDHLSNRTWPQLSGGRGPANSIARIIPSRNQLLASR